ncbi:MAG TPA: hypothetical protein VGK78_18945 [Nocardioides sp.]|uniref:hypothetical protein n=1 Tax=Nocardioides sp. TaxID=35761 RepID=UPI002F3ECE19
MRGRRALVPAVLLSAVALLGACSAAPQTGGVDPVTRHTQTARPDLSTSSDPYVHLASALHHRGVQVWFEADLVKAWLGGPAAFQTAVHRLGRLAKVPGVAGFKIADELGYHDGIESPDEALRFLTAAHRALHAVAPHAQVLVDMVVPELGCLPWLDAAGDSCAVNARSTSPAATVDAVTRYLRAGLIDRLDLSTGLLDASSYAARGLTLQAAQKDAWAEVDQLGWGSLTTLQARKALAAPGGYQGSTAQAGADVDTYIDIPADAGAASIDIWTWRQPYDGATVSLLAPSLAPNPLWDALARLRNGSTALLTHMTPSQMPTDHAAFDHECDLVSRVFAGVFVAAGTG